jgi:hypothetical protein
MIQQPMTYDDKWLSMVLAATLYVLQLHMNIIFYVLIQQCNNVTSANAHSPCISWYANVLYITSNDTCKIWADTCR